MAYADVHWHTTTCSACHHSIHPRATGYLRFGEFWYHRECVPTCRTCGRSIGPEDEAAWTYHAHVISTPFGYVQRPTSFLCPICIDGALCDEAPYLD